MSIPTYNGQTIPIIALPPDWSQPVSWSQHYATTISEALSTAEERQARFPRPLYGLRYSTLGLDAAETAYLRRIIETADDLPVGCPFWPLAARLTAPAASGATSLATDSTEGCLFGVFYQFALLWESFEHWEIIELSSVLAAGFDCQPIAGSYGSEAVVLPLAYGHVPRGPVSQLTDEHGRWDCDFNETFHRLHDQSLIEGTIPDPPAAPSELAASTVSDSQINLSWTDNSGSENGFRIEMKVGGTYTEIASTSANVTSYAVTGLLSLTEYFFRVRAVNVAGFSDYSNEASATTSGSVLTPYGDTFNTYPTGAAGTFADGSGFVGPWVLQNFETLVPYGDNFDTYPTGAVGTLNGGTGFTADWIYG